MGRIRFEPIIRILGALLIVACVAAPATPAAASAANRHGSPPEPDRSFILAGDDCFEVAVFLSITIEAARRHVPPEFNLSGEASGRALLLAGYAACGAGRVDGAELPAHMTGEISIFVESPSGNASDFADYVVRWPTDARDIERALHTLRWDATRAKSEGIAQGAFAGVRTASVRAELPGFDFRLDVSAPDVPEILPEHDSILWTKTHKGYAHARFHVEEGEMFVGRGIVAAEPSSPLAQLIGGTSAAGPGLLLRFDYEGPVLASQTLR